MKIWSLPKHENLSTDKKILWKREGAISPLFHNIFNISLTSRVQLHIYLLNVVNRIIFSSILQIWYVEVRISGSISEGPLEFEITRVDCIYIVCYSSRRLTFTTLWAFSIDGKLMIFFLFFRVNWIWHFMQIVSSGDNLHEMSNPVFWEK